MKDIWDELNKLPPPKKPCKRRRKPEAKVQKAIVLWLNAEVGAVLAVTDAGVLSKMGLNMSCGIPAGWPDITACLPGGRFLGIEVKSARGRQSDAQKFIQARIEKAGGLYILAHSLDEAKKILGLHLHDND